MDALERLRAARKPPESALVKLTRVTVKAHERRHNGHLEHVDTYTYERQGGAAQHASAGQSGGASSSTSSARSAPAKVSRTKLPNGKYRYTVDGKVHTQASGTEYTHASVYQNSDGGKVVFLHRRAELAAKGHPIYNKLVDQGKAKRLGHTSIDGGGDSGSATPAGPSQPAAHAPTPAASGSSSDSSGNGVPEISGHGTMATYTPVEKMTKDVATRWLNASPTGTIIKDKAMRQSYVKVGDRWVTGDAKGKPDVTPTQLMVKMLAAIVGKNPKNYSVNHRRFIHLSAVSELQAVVELAAAGTLNWSPKKNWVENAGGLPKFINDMALHMMQHSGLTREHAIAASVQRTKVLAAKGNRRAIQALAQWEALKAKNAAKHAAK